MDPFSPEAEALLARHRAEALEVARINHERWVIEARKRTADQMRRILGDIAEAIYSYGRESDDVAEELERLGAVLHEDGLTPAQRRDVWAWVAAVDECWGW